MTDQLYDEREDERDSAADAARGPTEREEEGKPYASPDDLEQEETDDSSASGSL
jgi:hypothetical protein